MRVRMVGGQLASRPLSSVYTKLLQIRHTFPKFLLEVFYNTAQAKAFV